MTVGDMNISVISDGDKLMGTTKITLANVVNFLPPWVKMLNFLLEIRENDKITFPNLSPQTSWILWRNFI
jgi:hypothetical protein